MMWDDSWNTGQWTAMLLMMLLLVALGVAVVAWLFRELGSAATRNAPRDEAPRSPEQILAERFARGEIDEEEFARRAGMLRQPRA